MIETADRVAVTMLSVLASEEQWYSLISAESAGQAETTAWVQELRIDPRVVLDAANEIRANQPAFERVRELLIQFCPSPPCWDDSLRRVFLEVVRMYYRLRLTPPSTSA